MTIDVRTLQMILTIIFTPAVLSPAGDAFAAILAQDAFPPFVNDILAWFVLIATGVGSVFAANQITSLPVFAYALIPAIFLLVNGSMGKLRPYLVGLDWIQSNVFDVAKGATPGLQNFDLARLVAAAVPEIERAVQKYIQPAGQQATQRTQKPTPKPILLTNAGPTESNAANPNLDAPMTWPANNTFSSNTPSPQQSFPGIQQVQSPFAANTSATATPGLGLVQSTIPAQPAQPEPASNLLQFSPLTRHFGDSQVIPVPPPQQ